MSGQVDQIITAAWVAPMNRAPIQNGAIAISTGSIVAVDEARPLRQLYPEARLIELPDATLLPGLVNAHVHLELPGELAFTRPTRGFVGWIQNLIASAPVDPDALAARVVTSTQESISQCLRFGVTTVGDISRHCEITRTLLARSPLRAVSFGEVTAMAKRREMLIERLPIVTDRAMESAKLQIGITPHAPYSVETDGYHRCVALAVAQAMPIATHLAETPHEARFLSDHSGPLRELWSWLGFWDDRVPRFDGGPIRFAKHVGLLDVPGVLAHVNYCDDAELEILAQGKASVVYCPRTHAYFGHIPHRWREMLKRGINVAAGTDSRASSPDLNLLADLRLLRRLAADISPTQIWEMGTINGAAALGVAAQVGTLEPGKRADVIAYRACGADPLAEILDGDELAPSAVWIDGRRLV